MNVKSLSMLVCLLFVFLSVTACDQSDSSAEQMSGKLLMTFKSYDATYTKRDDGYFHLSSERVEVLTNIEMSGEPPIEESSIDEDDLPDESIGEYQKIRIVRERDGTLFFEEQFKHVFEGQPVEVNERYEIKFIEGSWSDYEAGRRVKLEYTDAGLETAKQVMEKQVAEQLGEVFRQIFYVQVQSSLRENHGLNVALQDLERDLDATVDFNISVSEMSNSTIVIDNDRIDMSDQGPTRVSMTMSMEYDLPE